MAFCGDVKFVPKFSETHSHLQIGEKGEKGKTKYDLGRLLAIRKNAPKPRDFVLCGDPSGNVSPTPSINRWDQNLFGRAKKVISIRPWPSDHRPATPFRSPTTNHETLPPPEGRGELCRFSLKEAERRTNAKGRKMGRNIEKYPRTAFDQERPNPFECK